jgi:hypothetical protein
MGIARRKAGTVVTCPTCSGQVVVPAPEPSTAQAGSSDPDKPALFEHQDFDQIFGQGANEPRKVMASAAPVESVVPASPVSSAELDALPKPVRLPGIYLAPLTATLCIIFFLILLAIAFLGGYFLGTAAS